MITPRGLTEAEVRNSHNPIGAIGQLTGAQIAPVCTTTENITHPSAKHDRLLASFGDVEIAERNPARDKYNGSVAQGVEHHYGPFRVVEGTTFDVVMTGTGNVDLYLRWGAAPTTTSYDCRPYSGLSYERCRLAVPAGTTHVYIMARGYTAGTYTAAVNYTTPGPTLYDSLVRRRKLTYEHYGEALDAPRRAQAVALYQSYPGVNPACGVNAPAQLPTCHAESHWRSQLCARLGSQHVAADLVAMDYEQCVTLLTSLGAALGTPACPDYQPYINHSVGAHQTLHTKLLLDLAGDLAASPRSPSNVPQYDRARVAQLLRLIDRWFTGADAILEEPGLADQLSLLMNRFWQAAHGYAFPAGANAPNWLRDSMYHELEGEIARAKEAEAGGNPTRAQAIIQEALDLTELWGLALDRTVLEAAYQGGPNGTPSLRGLPLVAITGDGLAPLASRLDALVEYHDTGCVMTRCVGWVQPTALSRYWKILAHLTSTAAGSSLQDVLNASPGNLAGWKPTFQAIANQQSALITGLNAATGVFAQRALELPRLIERGRQRTQAYHTTGLFQPAAGDVLKTGVHSAQRQRILEHIDGQNATIEAAKSDLESRLVTLVDRNVQANNSESAVAHLRATLTRLGNHLEDLGKKATAYHQMVAAGANTPDSKASLLEDLMKRWATTQSATADGQFIRVASTTTHLLTGNDAKFTRWDRQTVADLAVHSMLNVGAKNIVSISTENQWAPICAVRQARMIDPDLAFEPGAVGQRINTAGAFTGPEGYSITWTGSSWDATSTHGGVSRRITAGVRVEACGGTPGMAVTGTGVRACGYVDASVTGEGGTNWQNGSEGRTAAQFSSGLFLPTTPFEAPAGSLLVIEMPPGATDKARIRDVHLVRAPHSTLVVDENADLYFVVNDIRDSGCTPDRLNVLRVDVGTYMRFGDAANALVKRMAHTMTLVRNRGRELAERGEVLPSELEAIERQAKLDQIGTPPVAVDAYPDAFRDLFYAYLAKEIVRLEAGVRLTNILREIEDTQDEFRATAVALRNASLSGYLVALLPKWSTRSMRLRELREVSADYAYNMRYYLQPMLELWYPDVANGLGNVAELQQLANIDVDVSRLEMVGWLASGGRAIRQRTQQSRVPYPDPNQAGMVFVSLRFANPLHMDTLCKDTPGARCHVDRESASFRWATVDQANKLWDDLGTADPQNPNRLRRLTFAVDPADLYERYAGSAYLSCTLELPVIRRIGLVLTGYARGIPPPRSMEGLIPATKSLLFVTPRGRKAFFLENPVWRTLNTVPLVYINNDYQQAQQQFLAISQDIRGVAPFTTFEFQIRERTVEEWQLRSAKSIDLVMEVEGIPTGAPVQVPTCTSTP